MRKKGSLEDILLFAGAMIACGIAIAFVLIGVYR